MLGVNVQFKVLKNDWKEYANKTRYNKTWALKKALLKLREIAANNLLQNEKIPPGTGALASSIYVMISHYDDEDKALAAALALNPRMNWITADKSDVDASHGKVVVGGEYGIYVERGTSKMAPKPFFQPAVDEAEDYFRELLFRIISLYPMESLQESDQEIIED